MQYENKFIFDITFRLPFPLVKYISTKNKLLHSHEYEQTKMHVMLMMPLF